MKPSFVPVQTVELASITLSLNSSTCGGLSRW